MNKRGEKKRKEKERKENNIILLVGAFHDETLRDRGPWIHPWESMGFKIHGIYFKPIIESIENTSLVKSGLVFFFHGLLSNAPLLI